MATALSAVAPPLGRSCRVRSVQPKRHHSSAMIRPAFAAPVWSCPTPAACSSAESPVFTYDQPGSGQKVWKGRGGAWTQSSVGRRAVPAFRASARCITKPFARLVGHVFTCPRAPGCLRPSWSPRGDHAIESIAVPAGIGDGLESVDVPGDHVGEFGPGGRMKRIGEEDGVGAVGYSRELD